MYPLSFCIGRIKTSLYEKIKKRTDYEVQRLSRICKDKHVNYIPCDVKELLKNA